MAKYAQMVHEYIGGHLRSSTHVPNYGLRRPSGVSSEFRIFGSEYRMSFGKSEVCVVYHQSDLCA